MEEKKELITAEMYNDYMVNIADAFAALAQIETDESLSKGECDSLRYALQAYHKMTNALWRGDLSRLE